MSITLSNFLIEKVSKDDLGKFLKLHIQLPDGHCVIRWGLDEFTYLQMNKIVSNKYFDPLAVDYKYELVPYVSTYHDRKNNSTYFKGVIRCIQGRRIARVEFICSDQFAANMEWFKKEVRNAEDVRHVLWDHFNE